MLFRMKYINRWGLMRNIRNENLCEHSTDVAFLAHALSLIKNEYFNGSVDPARVAAAALFHDTPEIMTGDLPTPVKYHNREISAAYKSVEKTARSKLLSMLPDRLVPHYRPLMECDLPEEEQKIIKAADKLAALIKCLEEQQLGNAEFKQAAISLRKILDDMALIEVDFFITEFLPCFLLTLDEQDFSKT